MVFCAEWLYAVIGHPQYDRIFQGFHKEGGGAFCDIAVKIAHKPIIHGDLYRMFLPFMIQEKGSKGARNHVVAVLAHKTGLIDVLAFFDPFRCRNGNNIGFCR